MAAPGQRAFPNSNFNRDLTCGTLISNRLRVLHQATVPAPSADTDAATKAYVDSTVASHFYDTVSTAANLDLNVAAYFTETMLFVFVDTSVGPSITVSLPLIANIDATRKKIIHVVDVAGNAQAFPITVQRSGADLINANADVDITQNNNALSFVSDTTTNWYIF